jgi:hypothetical protein
VDGAEAAGMGALSTARRGAMSATFVPGFGVAGFVAEVCGGASLGGAVLTSALWLAGRVARARPPTSAAATPPQARTSHSHGFDAVRPRRNGRGAASGRRFARVGS